MWLHANGLKFFAQRRGSGPPLIFLGGSGWDLRLPPTPLESDLPKFFDVVLFDQRGVGQSDKPDGPYSMVDYAEDAKGIMDAMGWEKAHVVGYSFGGMVAQEFALAFPECVDKLVLAATSPGGEEHASFPIEKFLDLSPTERAAKSVQVANTLYDSKFEEQNPDAFRALVEKRLLRQQAHMDSETAKDGYRNQLMARKDHNTCARLHKIHAPTLILSGATDGQASQSGQHFMEAEIPNASHAVVEGGHNFIFEHDYAIKEMLTFLKNH